MKENPEQPGYWETRYETQNTPWTIGYPSPPLTRHFQTLSNKEARLLIPGCGEAYEGEYLFRAGFKNVILLDIAPEAKKRFFERVPGFPSHHFIVGDFFALQDQFDYIVEQTFFCALPPYRREDILKKTAELLAPTGEFFGLLFNDALNADKPPYGGYLADYLPLFKKYFDVLEMDITPYSIAPRSGRELFFRCVTKK